MTEPDPGRPPSRGSAVPNGGPTATPDTGRRRVEVSISTRTILLIAGAVAIAWAVVSIADVLLVIFVSLFSIAVLSPVVTAMERHLGWSRATCSSAVVLTVVVVLGAGLLVLVQAATDSVRQLSHDLPQIIDETRHSELGNAINAGSDSLDTLRRHAGDITRGVGKASAGVAQIGVSAFGAVTLVLSVIFLTLYGLVDAPRVRDWIGGLLYQDDRERYLRVTDRIIHTTSRYMLGNLAISVICGSVYGLTAVVLDIPHPLALAVIAGVLDLIPTIGATIAGVVIVVVSLSVSLEATIVFVIVIVIYQQIENYVLQPAIIGKATQVAAFGVLASVLAFGALFGLIGAIIAVPIAAGIQTVVEELTAGRRGRITAADATDPRRPAQLTQTG
jgi:predicted PurR-regulated permease PerM